MSRIKKTTKTVLAVLLSLTVAATFYPVTAFAGTDYEAAYYQAQAATQTAYDNWQNAIADRDAKERAYNQAKTEASQAAAAVEPAYQDMLKKQRLLDLKTRQVIESMSETDYKHDFPSDASHTENYKTESRMNYIMSKTYSSTSNTNLKNYINSKTSAENAQWNTPGKYWRTNNPNTKRKIPQGFTTTTAGNDDTSSLTLYQKYVYFNQSYDTIMLSLDYFDETNQLRALKGKSAVKVSSYIMLQASVNAPMNAYSHTIDTYVSGGDGAQNLTGRWGDVDCFTDKYNSSYNTDPLRALFWAEEYKNGGHYKNIIGDHTHAGMSCSAATSAFNDLSYPLTVFEQDFHNRPGATGYTVTEYRNIINNKVNSELSAYNSAKTAYERAQATADSKADDAEGLLYDYADAKTEVSYAKADYDNAVAAEQSAYEAYQNWLNNGSGDDNGDDPVNPDEGGSEPSVPTSIDSITQLTASYDGKEGSQYVIRVSWKSANGANKYEIQESINGGSWSNKSPVTSPYTYIYTDKANTRFKYRVRGVYEGNGTTVYGNYTTSSECSTPAAETPTVTVGKVTNVTLTQTGWNGLTNSYNVKIAWGSVDGASKYKVFTSINNGNYESEIYTTTSCTCSVPYNGTVKCKVAAMDSNGNVGPESDVKSLTVGDGSDPGSDPQPENVGPVTGVKATTGDVTVTSCKVTISWEKASNATSYTVYKSTNGTNYTDSQTTSATSKEYNLAPNTKYWFKVRGTNGNVNGQMSEVLAFTTPKYEQTVEPTDQTQPVTPVYVKNYVKSLKVVKGKKSFKVKWKKQSKANQKKFSGYQIRYSLKKNMSSAKYTTAKKSSASKKIKKLKAKKKYYVQVRTYKVQNGTKYYSKWSAKKSVKTK